MYPYIVYIHMCLYIHQIMLPSSIRLHRCGKSITNVDHYPNEKPWLLNIYGNV